MGAYGAEGLKTRMGIDRRNSRGAMRGPACVGRTVHRRCPPTAVERPTRCPS